MELYWELIPEPQRTRWWPTKTVPRSTTSQTISSEFLRQLTTKSVWNRCNLKTAVLHDINRLLVYVLVVIFDKQWNSYVLYFCTDMVSVWWYCFVEQTLLSLDDRIPVVTYNANKLANVPSHYLCQYSAAVVRVRLPILRWPHRWSPLRSNSTSWTPVVHHVSVQPTECSNRCSSGKWFVDIVTIPVLE